MTAKQKAARERFKKVQAEAKKLRAKNPRLSQTEAVKQAWAIFKKSGKIGEKHTDTKSHNVNIRVVSGWKKGKTAIIEKGEKLKKKLKNVRVYRIKKNDMFDKPGTFKKFTTLTGIGSTTSEKAQSYLINNIDLSGYDLYPKSKPESVKMLYKIFMDEYGWAVKRYGMQKAVMEWLMGIPSSINIAFWNDDILKLAKSWGTLPENATEKQEDKILKNYWNLMSANLVRLFNKYKNAA